MICDATCCLCFLFVGVVAVLLFDCVFVCDLFSVCFCACLFSLLIVLGLGLRWFENLLFHVLCVVLGVWFMLICCVLLFSFNRLLIACVFCCWVVCLLLLFFV